MQPETLPPAPSVVGRRVVAGIIDLVLLLVVFAFVADRFRGTEVVDGVETSTLSGAALLIYLLTFLGYYLVAETLFATTIGKAATGLQVRMVDGSLPGFGAILTRTVLRLVDGLPLVYVVGIITVVASRRDQRLGDMAAETLVVDSRRLGRRERSG